MSEMKSNIIDFEIIAKRNTDKLLLKSENIGLTYGDCLNFVDTIMSNVTHKFDAGEPVGIVSPNSPEFVVSVLTLWKLGAVPVPINPTLPIDEIIERLSLCGIKKVFTSSSLKLAEIEIEAIPLPDLKRIPYGNSNPYQKRENKTAVMIFTSGSSGKAKCVEITFENLIANNRLIVNEFHIQNEESWLVSLPMYHIGGFAIISRALLSSGTLYFPESLRAEEILKSIRKYKPNNLSLVSPTLFHMVGNNFSVPRECKNIFAGGGKIDRELIKKAVDTNYPIHLVYGSTETTSMISAVKYEMLKTNINSGAKIFKDVEINFTESELQNNSAARIGELIIKSPTVAKGYFNNNSETMRKFSKGRFTSGDYGFIDDEGLLHILGRIDDTIISGGENVNTSEIEQKLKMINGVKDCAVIGINDSKWGEKIIAVFVRDKNSNVSAKEIIIFAKENLPNFQVPKEIIFKDEIPRNELGKLQKEKLVKIIGREKK